MEEEDLKIENATHGVIAIDRDGNIHHFIGLWTKPTPEFIEEMREELKTDPEFGLTEMMHKLAVVEAPIDIVDYFCRNDEPL